MKLIPGRCAHCGKRWKRGQNTKKYCGNTCKVAAFWKRKFLAEQVVERRDGERRATDRRAKSAA